MVDNIKSASSRPTTWTEDLADQSHFPNDVNEYDEYAQDTFDGSGNALNTQDLREQYEEGERESNIEDYSDFLDTEEDAIESEQDYSDFLDIDEEGIEMDRYPDPPVSRLRSYHGSNFGNVVMDVNRHFDPGQFDQQSGVSVGANVLKAGVNVALMVDGLLNRDNDEEKERLANLLNGIEQAGKRFQELEKRAEGVEEQVSIGSAESLSQADREHLSSVREATTQRDNRTDHVQEETKAVEEELVDLWDDDEPEEEQVEKSKKSLDSTDSLSSTVNYMGEKLGENQLLVDPNASFSDQLSQAEKALSLINRRLDQLEERLDAIETKLETGEDKQLTNHFADSLSDLAHNYGQLTDEGYLQVKTQSGGTILSAPEGNSLFVSTSGDEFFVGTKAEGKDWVSTEDDFSADFKQKVINWASEENNAFSSNQSESTVNSDFSQKDKKQMEQ